MRLCTDARCFLFLPSSPYFIRLFWESKLVNKFELLLSLKTELSFFMQFLYWFRIYIYSNWSRFMKYLHIFAQANLENLMQLEANFLCRAIWNWHFFFLCYDYCLLSCVIPTCDHEILCLIWIYSSYFSNNVSGSFKYFWQISMLIWF